MMKEKVEVKVQEIGIKEWFNDENLPMLKAKQNFLNDPENQTLKKIVNSEVVYQIIYSAEHPTESGSGINIEQRVLLTDLEDVNDITFLTMTTNLAGCRYETQQEYPEMVDQIIIEFIFGEKWDFTTPAEEYRRYMKHRNTSN